MKNSFSILALTIAASFFWLSAVAASKPPPVSYAGGDGSSFERAIVIKASDEKTGVDAEYAYIARHYPGYRRGRQGLADRKGHAFDILDFTTKEGKKHTLYFDITSFFGKF
jgi:hypothetical protein